MFSLAVIFSLRINELVFSTVDQYFFVRLVGLIFVVTVVQISIYLKEYVCPKSNENDLKINLLNIHAITV